MGDGEKHIGESEKTEREVCFSLISPRDIVALQFAVVLEYDYTRGSLDRSCTYSLFLVSLLQIHPYIPLGGLVHDVPWRQQSPKSV